MKRISYSLVAMVTLFFIGCQAESVEESNEHQLTEYFAPVKTNQVNTSTSKGPCREKAYFWNQDANGNRSNCWSIMTDCKSFSNVTFLNRVPCVETAGIGGTKI